MTRNQYAISWLLTDVCSLNEKRSEPYNSIAHTIDLKSVYLYLGNPYTIEI